MVSTRSQTLINKKTVVKRSPSRMKKSKSEKQESKALSQFKIEIENLIKSSIQKNIKTLTAKLNKIEEDLNILKTKTINELEILIENMKKKSNYNTTDKYRRKPKHDQVIHYLGGFMDV
jgi:hypothetical protein